MLFVEIWMISNAKIDILLLQSDERILIYDQIINLQKPEVPLFWCTK